MGTKKKQAEKSDTMIELEEVLDEVKAAIMTAIAEENRDSGTGDKPRCVGLRLRKNPKTSLLGNYKQECVLGKLL